jgi:FlaA1/EpsC-like NDP-sugar epimerase
VVAAHGGLAFTGYLVAFVLRFDWPVPAVEIGRFWTTVPFVVGVRLAAFYRLGLFRTIWRYVGIADVLRIIKAVTLGSLVYTMVLLAIGAVSSYPRPVLLLDWLLNLLGVTGCRFLIRAMRESSDRSDTAMNKRALIAGAGRAGEQLIRAVRNKTLPYDIVGLVDDDVRKQRKSMHGIEVVGTIDDLPLLCEALNVEEVLIAAPSSSPEERRRIADRCRESRVAVKSVPSLGELLGGRAGINHLQEVPPEDLLGRKPVRVDREACETEIRDGRVLITGAGGSIGSEVCRQLAGLHPETLILYDRAETSLYYANLQLHKQWPDIDIVPVVGDVRDRPRLSEVMATYRPHVVYHAAAYKHVPLMEGHPLEAIENNLFGTESVALAAREVGVQKVVFISTDKAVNPVGVMGMTKRAGENLLLTLDGPTIFASVRFGNVLGTEGSVLPLFRWQLAMGGPLTVTDLEATRYFMLLTEAAQLVIQAGAMAEGYEVFILDMGNPVRIGDLAEDVIRLSGFTPGRDIGVDVVGLRPGERLTEALNEDVGRLVASPQEGILIARPERPDTRAFARDLEDLRSALAQRDVPDALRLLKLLCYGTEARSREPG